MTENINERLKTKLSRALPSFVSALTVAPPGDKKNTLTKLVTKLYKLHRMLNNPALAQGPEPCPLDHTNEQEQACCLLCLTYSHWPQYLADVEEILDSWQTEAKQ